MNYAHLTRDQLKTEIGLYGTGSYFDHSFGTWVEAHFGARTEDVMKMVRVEARAFIEDGVLKGRNKEGRAQQRACESILSWLTEADEWSVKTDDLANIADFVLSHRQACAWAILLGKAGPFKLVDTAV